MSKLIVIHEYKTSQTPEIGTIFPGMVAHLFNPRYRGRWVSMNSRPISST